MRARRAGHFSSDKVRFFTRLFPLGSTRNIDVSTYGSSRLQLPSRATFVDHNTDRYGVFEDSEEDAFAGIFPQYIGTVTAVRSESKTDENGKQFTVYYIKDSGMTWEPQALPEQSFMLSFQTGDLQGYGDDTNKSFQAEWHKDTKEWEIINIWLDENTQIPGGNIVPVVGNQYFPWNMIMPQEYITEAEKRYEAAVNDFVANYSGEPVTGLAEGRPLMVRRPDARLTLANLARVQLYAAMATLKLGMDILFEGEGVQLDTLLGHGGLFKTPVVGQRLLAGALGVPVAVMETAGEGGPWGMALLAAYMLEKWPGETLEQYLANRVFADAKGAVQRPREEDCAGFARFMEDYKTGLAVERAAVEALR